MLIVLCIIRSHLSKLFHRMFNVTLPWNHPLDNKLGQAEPYEPLVCGFVNGLKTRPSHQHHTRMSPQRGTLIVRWPGSRPQSGLDFSFSTEGD